MVASPETVPTSKRRPRPDFVASVDTLALHKRLMSAQVGEIVSYAELSDLIGRSVQRVAYAALASARRRAEAEGSEFGTVIKIGLERLDENRAVEKALRGLGRIRKLSRRELRRLSRRQFDQLDSAHQVSHNTGMAAFSVFQHMTSRGKLEQLEQAVARTQQALPLAKTLEIFAH